MPALKSAPLLGGLQPGAQAPAPTRAHARTGSLPALEASCTRGNWGRVFGSDRRFSALTVQGDSHAVGLVLCNATDRHDFLRSDEI